MLFIYVFIYLFIFCGLIAIKLIARCDLFVLKSSDNKCLNVWTLLLLYLVEVIIKSGTIGSQWLVICYKCPALGALAHKDFKGIQLGKG